MSGSSSITSKWGWFVVLGLVSILAGVFALGHPLLFTLIGVLFIGASLIVSGITQIIQSFMAKGWSNSAFGIIGGLLSIIGGVLVMQEPVTGSVVITLFLLAALVVGGVLRIMIAFKHRELPMWWLLALGGVVSVIVGIMLYAALPWSGLWVLGTLIGVELLFQGIGWLGFGMDLRKRHAG
jgi:uncharacterized membrane protein HdeD (DUF308 family)